MNQLLIPVFVGASYTVIARSDRAAGQHSGLLIALENEFFASENVLFQSNSYFCVLLRLPTLILCIVLVYLPPRSSVYFVRPYEVEAMLKALSNELKTFLDSSDFSTWIDLQWVLLDDFNFPDVCWDTILSRHSDEQYLLDFISEELLFTQIMDSPTHRHGNILDLIFCSTEDLWDVELKSPVLSDNYAIILKSEVECF